MSEPVFIGKSNAIKKLQKDIPRLVKLSKNILIAGERGVGKTTYAGLIHARAKRSGKLLTVNAMTSPEYEINAALENNAPDISTILFQDIAEFSFLYQAKINSFANSLPKKNAVQIIFTSADDIHELLKQGKLLQDIFPTLEKCERVSLPPLSKRKEDIPLLIEHFINTACKSMNIEMKAIDINALDFLIRREWKENIRELKSSIETAVFTSKEGSLELPKNLVDEYLQLDGILTNIDQKRIFSFDKSLSNLEKTLIERTLEAVGFNQTRAAEVLNLSDANFRYRLRKFHILKEKKR